MKGFLTEQPFKQPRPMFASLPAAVAAAVRSETKLEEINLALWARTYDSTKDEVEAEFIQALTKIPPNSNIAAEGK